MKKFLLILAVVGAALSALGGLDLAGVITFLPKQWAGALAIVPPVAAAMLHFVMLIGDILDDGEQNGSFKIGNYRVKVDKVPLIAVFAVALLFLPSCTNPVGMALLTGQDIPTTPVRRVDDPTAPVVDIATSDLRLAEAAPKKTAWGLYDAGYLTEQARAAVVEATK